MADDLVERLRRGWSNSDIDAVMNEAAAEIARLRARPGWREGVEAAAVFLDAGAQNIRERVLGYLLSSQMKEVVEGTAVLLTDYAAAIRALKEPT